MLEVYIYKVLDHLKCLSLTNFVNVTRNKETLASKLIDTSV